MEETGVPSNVWRCNVLDMFLSKKKFVAISECKLIISLYRIRYVPTIV